MIELLGQVVDKWVLLFAILSVGVTEAFMRTTGEKVTRRKYAMLSTGIVAILFSVAYSFDPETQADVTWQDGLARGVISAVIAIIGYDAFKSAVAHLPFMNKSD